MAARIGRQTDFFFGGDSPGDNILGIREIGLSFNGEGVDITSGEDNGYRTLLTNISAQDEVEITVSGVTKDTRMKEAWSNGEKTQPITIIYPDGSTFTGTFFLSSYSEGEPYNDASTFDATLMSSGQTTFTPA